MTDSKNELVNEAIDASIEFEKLMDKTDFDSWLDDDDAQKDNAVILEDLGQDPAPFIIYEENKKKLKGICESINSGVKKSNNSGDKSFLEETIFNLFQSKYLRMEARICSNKKEEEDKYSEALYHLLSGLYTYQNPAAGNIDERLLVLLYNDLSICHSGLENSSLSRGYAEEARSIIKKMEGKIEFIKIPRLYNLYTIAIFNQALAEKRSQLYVDAERDFKIILDYGKDPNMINFNYYSALLNMSDLYMDLGRCQEAVELLIKVKDEVEKDDKRYWDASLLMITALIEKTEYKEAERFLFKDIIEKVNGSVATKRQHKITATGFWGLSYYVRCKIEKERNILKRNNNSEDELKNILKIIDSKFFEKIQERKQEGIEIKTYKQLSDIYKLLHEDKNIIKYLVKFISKTKYDDLTAFALDSKMGKWIEDCDDLGALESFTIQILKEIKNKEINNYRKLLEKLKEIITKECEDKYQLSRAERIVSMIDKILDIKDEIPYLGDKYFKKWTHKEGNLTKEDIRKRLDLNEKEFDSVLFKRTKMRKENNIVELIILRRWNSFSPGLYRGYSGSLGGGYVLRVNKELMGENYAEEKEENSGIENIVIDPGYNFLENFSKEGFCINDIDTIIVTHSHLDHSAELLPIMDLIFQINKRYKYNRYDEEPKQKRVKLCLSQGAYKKFFGYIEDQDWKKQLKDVIILENLTSQECKLLKYLKVSAIKTYHMDLGGVNSIGLKFKLDIKGENDLVIGFTGDTPWEPRLKKYFEGCDILCVHIGSIKYQEIGYTDKIYMPENEREEKDKEEKYKEKYREANHLLYFGTEDIIKACANKAKNNLIIVSEFGEELKYGIRKDLCKKFNEIKNIDCIPGDIGLNIAVEKDSTKKVRCNFCEGFVGQEKIKTFSYGKEDAFHYICQTCDNTLTELQKQAFIEHRVTRH